MYVRARVHAVLIIPQGEENVHAHSDAQVNKKYVYVYIVN